MTVPHPTGLTTAGPSPAPTATGATSTKLAARCDGFSLEAGRHLHENDRRGLEALLQYCLRAPLAQDRLTWSSDDQSQVTLRLKRPMANGQTTLRMKPLDLLRRLAGLVPPPRVHQIHYFGGFSSHSNLRRRIVARSPKRRRCRMDDACIEQRALPLPAPVVPGGEPEALPLIKAPAPRARELDWRALLRRTFARDLFDCGCGGRRRSSRS